MSQGWVLMHARSGQRVPLDWRYIGSSSCLMFVHVIDEGNESGVQVQVRSTGHQGMCGHSHEGIVGSKVSSELNRRTKLGLMRRVVCIVVYCSCIVYLRVSLCIVAFHGVVYRLCMVVFWCRVWWCYHGVPWCSWFSSELNRRTKLGQTGAGFPQS
jgi:hypothetical protein